MGSSIDRPVLEEPWAKRLRVTRSRSAKVGQEQLHSDHLPSPKPTNPSSTDNIPSSSSSSDHKSKLKSKPVLSLRDRLVPVPKKPTSLPQVDSGTAHTKPTSKPSVAPFFKRIEAAFQGKPTVDPKTNHTSTVTRTRARSPSPDAEDLILQLKEHYLQTATTLHKRATMHLAQTHSSLALKLAQSLTKPDTSFLESTESQIKKLSQPLEKFSIRSQQRTANGAVNSEEHTVAGLISRAEEQVTEFEREVGGLWEEWAVAEGEVKGLLNGIAATAAAAASSGGPLPGGRVGRSGDDGEGEEVLRVFGEKIEREIALAEEEVIELGQEAVGVMKEIEKDFRKVTLPDLHTFFQSIDEP